MNKDGDFRSEAAAESVRIVEAQGASARDDYSLCVPASATGAAAVRRYAYMVLLRFVLGLAGIAGGAVIGALDQRVDDDQAFSVWLILAVCCSIGGILVLFSDSLFQRWFVRRQLGMRYYELTSRVTQTRPVCVALESAGTFHKFKFVPEDLAYLSLEAARRLVVIEGVRYRYVIHGEDVRVIQQLAASGGTATSIVYAVGNTDLGIAVQHNSFWHTLKRQTVGAKVDPLIKRIRETLLEYSDAQEV